MPLNMMRNSPFISLKDTTNRTSRHDPLSTSLPSPHTPTTTTAPLLLILRIRLLKRLKPPPTLRTRARRPLLIIKELVVPHILHMPEPTTSTSSSAVAISP